MNKSFVFFGRHKEIKRLRALYELGQHVLIVGEVGIGKTAVLQRVRQLSGILICDDSSSLSRICGNLEPQLGWVHYRSSVTERKNRLLLGLERRGQPVAFDNVIHTAPRVARFIARVAEKIPIWIACRSGRPHDVGHIWPDLYKFRRIEISPLTEIETRMLIDDAAAQGEIQSNVRARASELHRISRGSPRILTGTPRAARSRRVQHRQFARPRFAGS